MTRELQRDKERVLARMREERKFMPYMHYDTPFAEIVKVVGGQTRAWRALTALVQDRKVYYTEGASPDCFAAYAEAPPAPMPKSKNEDVDENDIKPWVRPDDREQRVRATLAPRPKLHYPAPWRVAEKNPHGHVNVVCADGHYTAECPTREAAEAIVLAVNTFAGVAE